MLEVSGLCVNYAGTEAVVDCRISVGASSAVALLGPNGAGKTSTLKAISGLVEFKGTIEFDGVSLRRMTPEKIARIGLVHVPEGRRLFGSLNVHENLQIGQTSRGGRTGGYSIDDVYDLFPALRPIAKRAGWALSGGEQQMVAIGRGLVAAPRLLLLDEPSLGLAPIVVKNVFAALKAVSERTPVLLVEQNAVAAIDLCQRGYVLVDGRVAMQGTSEELGSREALIDSYLGQSSLAEVENRAP
ncbi:MAG: branched-chain amino acid transport system ATP-binding protein [Pseudonocardiales bacterium]|nr:branched-chain amino acid transport system ATP-binding protein [Pseudonocardiales bacterium]